MRLYGEIWTQPRVGGWVVFVFELQIVTFEGFLRILMMLNIHRNKLHFKIYSNRKQLF